MIRLLKNIIIINVIISLFAILNASVDMQVARKVADNIIIERSNNNNFIKNVIIDIENEIDNFYIFNLEPTGFIIVSANENTIPILGYSFNKNIDYEVEEYKKNIINKTNVNGYIWKMHNWSGNYENNLNPRAVKTKRSCGRPFAPELTIRAGGELGRTGAIVPCCQTLGPPNEIKSILSHLDNQSVEEVYFGEKYEKLRKTHREEEFDSIEYCKDCDFLDGDPNVLVWSDDKNARIDHMLGTDEDFTLTNKEYIEKM